IHHEHLEPEPTGKPRRTRPGETQIEPQFRELERRLRRRVVDLEGVRDAFERVWQPGSAPGPRGPSGEARRQAGNTTTSNVRAIPPVRLQHTRADVVVTGRRVR